MHPEIEQAIERLGMDGLPTLSANAAASEKTLNDVKGWLHERVDPEAAKPLDVVVLGSYARQEASSESDFDYLVIAHSVPEDVKATREVLNVVDDYISERLTAEGEDDRKRRPGATGLFGRITSAPDLTERIGLEQDTNISHSRRLLLLQESRSVYQPDLLARLRAAVLKRYLIDYAEPKTGVPRFLANDVIRYWYTLAIDYQAKRWEDEQKFGLRYLKLLLSRKISYAGALTSLLSCHLATPDYFLAEFAKPPLARIASLVLIDGFEQPESVGEVLLIAEEFAAFLADTDCREEAESVRGLNVEELPERFRIMRDRANDLHDALGRIFFESRLVDAARKYLAF